MPEEILESALAEASVDATTGRIQVTVLTPGWGSSGYYSDQVVEEAAALVQPGTLMYLDHATDAEAKQRPGRSVKDIAAKFVGEGRWDAKQRKTVAEAELVPGPYREALIALGGHIGVSISGSAKDISKGTAEGKTGRIVEGLAEIRSVDFVTRAGRGGEYAAIESLLESAELEDRVLSEATADDRMTHLRDAVRSTHGSADSSAWVRDQDAEKKTVWFDVHDHRTGGPAITYEQKYAVGDSDAEVTLTGKPKPVRAVTQYVSVTPAGPTKESKEDTVPKKEIEESELTRLTESAGRVPELEEQLRTALAENTTLKQATTEATLRESAVTAATARVKEGNSELPASVVTRIVEAAVTQVPVNAEGVLDTVTLHTRVDAARKTEETYLAELAKTTGSKLVGFGASTEVSETKSAPTRTPWGRDLSEKASA